MNVLRRCRRFVVLQVPLDLPPSVTMATVEYDVYSRRRDALAYARNKAASMASTDGEVRSDGGTLKVWRAGRCEYELSVWRFAAIKPDRA